MEDVEAVLVTTSPSAGWSRDGFDRVVRRGRVGTYGVLFLDVELEVDCARASGCYAELFDHKGQNLLV